MTIIPRNGRYGVKVWDRGQKRYRWIGSFGSEADAIRAEQDANLKPAVDAPTVEQWGRIWLSDYPREASATQRSYRYAVEQINAKLGTRKLADVYAPGSEAHSQQLAAHDGEGCPNDVGGCSARRSMRGQPVDQPPLGDAEGPQGHRRAD